MATDPVADKSGFLRMYMSNHPDTLVAYAKWYGKVTDTIVGAEMTAIDSQVSGLPFYEIMKRLTMVLPLFEEYDINVYPKKRREETCTCRHRASTVRL